MLSVSNHTTKHISKIVNIGSFPPDISRKIFLSQAVEKPSTAWDNFNSLR